MGGQAPPEVEVTMSGASSPAPAFFANPRVTERGLGLIAGDLDQLGALESRLEAVCGDIAAANIDESDEHGATRAYVERLAAAKLFELVVPTAFGGASDPVLATPICIARLPSLERLAA